MTELIVSRIHSVYQHFCALLWCQGPAAHSVRVFHQPSHRPESILAALDSPDPGLLQSFWRLGRAICSSWEEKTVCTWVMPEETSPVWDHVRSVKTDWTDNMNIVSSRAKKKKGKERAVLMGAISSSVSDCHRTCCSLRRQLCRDDPSDKQLTSQVSQSLAAVSVDLHSSVLQSPGDFF